MGNPSGEIEAELVRANALLRRCEAWFNRGNAAYRRECKRQGVDGHAGKTTLGRNLARYFAPGVT